MKIALVSGGDHKYYPMLVEWVHSIRRIMPPDIKADLCILDAGLRPEQKERLSLLAKHVKSPEWPASIESSRIRGREFLKACCARPFIRELFPGYDIYVWLDGDTWAQDWNAVDLLIRGAQKSGLAICPQTDRAYGKAMRLQWLGAFPFKARSFYYSNARKAFSGKIARQLFPYPTLNAGVFALSTNAPHWDRWQKLIVQALRKGKVFTAEQLTLGMIVYLEKYPAEFLPAWCNWLLTTPPAWDEERNLFVEPYLPHTPIGIMHLSGCDAMRTNRNIQEKIATVKGSIVSKSYRYPHYSDQEENQPPAFLVNAA